MDIIENGMVTDNVGLNFSEPDGIFGQNHVYDLSLLFLREYGPPSSFQVYLINLVFFFFEHIFLLLQFFILLYLHLDLTFWHGLRLFLLLLCGFPLSPSLFIFWLVPFGVKAAQSEAFLSPRVSGMDPPMGDPRSAQPYLKRSSPFVCL